MSRMEAVNTPRIDLGWKEHFGLSDHFRALGLSRDATDEEINDRIVTRAAGLLESMPQVKAEAEIARLEQVRDLLLAPGGRAAYIAAIDQAKKNILPAYLAVPVALVIVFTWHPFSTTPAPADAFDAYSACTKFVGNRLKAPATAKFQEYRDVAVSLPAQGGFRLRGHVDAQNAFGAMLRNHWECEVAFEGRTAKLKHLAID